MPCRALLIVAVTIIATSNAFADSQTRTYKFEYDPATGFLTKQIIEPGSPDLCLVTVYTYDDPFGNRTGATTRNCNGSSNEAPAPTGDALFAARTSSITYDAQGRFPISARNALNHSESLAFDPRFGAMTSLTGPNNLVTTWTYDGFGRTTSENRADGTSTTWSYNLCTTCPEGGKYSVTVAATGAPTSTSYYDLFGRIFRAEVQGFDGTLVRQDTQFDGQGRVLQVSHPYLTGATPVWTAFTYDILGRPSTQTEPNNATTSAAYDALTVTITNALNQTETRINNSQGQLVRVIRP